MIMSDRNMHLQDSALVRNKVEGLQGRGCAAAAGLEDVTVLTGHLMRQGLCAAALRAFEKERIPRVSTIATMEYVSFPSCTLQSLVFAVTGFVRSCLDPCLYSLLEVLGVLR